MNGAEFSDLFRGWRSGLLAESQNVCRDLAGDLAVFDKPEFKQR